MRLLLFLLTLPLLAQNALYLDLSGPWRVHSGDDLGYAEAGIDDRDWPTVTVPLPSNPLRGRRPGEGFWLRRMVSLPTGTDPSRLAVTLGTIRGAYEIYANGRRIGQSGGFERNQDQPIPQPLTFNLPAEVLVPGGSLQLAIRVRPNLQSPPQWVLPDVGPWVLTYRDHAPTGAGAAQLDQQFVEVSPNWAIAALLLGMAALSLLGWWSDRRRWELLLFAVASIAFGGYNLETLLSLRTSARPFGAWGGPATQLMWVVVGQVSFGVFVLAALRASLNRRWWILLGTPLALGSLLSLSFHFSPEIEAMLNLQRPFYVGFLTLALVNVAAIVLDWRRRAQTLPWDQRLLRLTILLYAVSQAEDWGRRVLRVPNLFPPQVYIGPYRVSRLDLLLLAVSAMILAMLLRRLVADRREKQRLESEFEAAGVIQRLLLDKAVLAQPGLTLDAVYAPAQEVGGDFYYVLDGQLVVVGDVSGKGLKAAMLVSLVIGALRMIPDRRPGEVLAALNRAVAGQADGGFVTCACARFEADGVVTVANAGHLPPYLDGAECEVDRGLPLGLVPDVVYAESTLTLARGSSLTFLSDGVVESENAQRELFGFERTREISGKPAGEIAAAARGWGQNDDITVVAVRRTS